MTGKAEIQNKQVVGLHNTTGPMNAYFVIITEPLSGFMGLKGGVVINDHTFLYVPMRMQISFPTFALEASGKTSGKGSASFLVPAQKARRSHPGNNYVRIILPKNMDTSLPAMLLETSSGREEA